MRVRYTLTWMTDIDPGNYVTDDIIAEETQYLLDDTSLYLQMLEDEDVEVSIVEVTDGD